jgi:N6-L-threonylcarbamoyladenine synthase
MGIQEISIAGGVSANSFIRSELERIGSIHNWKTYIPQFQYCTDNAAMIGICAYYQYLSQEFANQAVSPMARMPVGSR